MAFHNIAYSPYRHDNLNPNQLTLTEVRNLYDLY